MPKKAEKVKQVAKVKVAKVSGAKAKIAKAKVAKAKPATKKIAKATVQRSNSNRSRASRPPVTQPEAVQRSNSNRSRASRPPAAAPAAPPQAASALVNPISGLVGQAHVLVDGGEEFDVDLAYTDANKNSNKFYRIQILEKNDNSMYWMLQHWGKIGTKGQNLLKDFARKEDCLKAFHQKFKQKAGVPWAQRQQATSNATGKYRTLTEQRVAAAGGKVADANTVCFCLSWDDRVDLDIHCVLPDGKSCYYACKKPTNWIDLDVDKQAHHYGFQVENIVMKAAQSLDGVYRYFVRYYSGHGNPVDFKFVTNEFGKKSFQGAGISVREPSKDVPVVDITMKKGKVVKSDFKLPVSEVSMD